MKARRASAFIVSVWERAKKQGYGSIQIKQQGKKLTNHYFKLPAFIGDIEDFLSAAPKRTDIYFCPLPGLEKSRRKDSFKKSRLLWADLDEASPNCKPKPTIAWETSPGRYQALWILDKELPVSKSKVINRNLTYAIGADKGGWGLGKILRVPFTTNYKPQYSKPTVKLLWNRKKPLDFSGVKKFTKKLGAKQKKKSITPPPTKIPKKLADQWYNWQNIPEGKRSEKPHAWSWSFLERGITDEWVLRAVSEHPLTVKKYGDRAEQEVQRSIDKWHDSKPRGSISEWEAPRVIPATEFLSAQHEVRWMIKDIWLEDTVGMISGPPKVYKSWLSMDLGISIASGTPFMGNAGFRYRMDSQKRNDVLLVQEEDPRIVLARRLGRILESKGFDAGGYKKSGAKVKGDRLILKVSDPIPLHIVNASGFNLQATEYIEWLEETISNIQPRLVILDPLLVMMGDVDEYKAGEVVRLLRPLKLLRDRYNCSFCIVHHTYKLPSKGDTRRKGEQLYGTMAFHAWLESALHIRAFGDIDETRTIEVTREFKAAGSLEPFYVYFPPMDKEYRPEIKNKDDVREEQRQMKEEKKEVSKADKLKDDISRVYTLVKKQQPISGQEIQNELEWGRDKRMRVVKEAINQGHVVYEGPATGKSAKLVISE